VGISWLLCNRSADAGPQSALEDFANEKEFFDGVLDRSDYANSRAHQRCRDGCEGLLPVRQIGTLLGARRAESGRQGGRPVPTKNLAQPRIIDPTQAVAALIADPPSIDVRVVAGLDAHDSLAVVEMRPVEHKVQIDIASLAAAVAHGGSAGEIP